jgi:MoaA/NifB/PqqE/SkfB family radical SAM enzyme
LSGGEPTLHPDFLRVAEYITEKKLNLTILSNGEKFYDKKFSDAFFKVVDIQRTTVVTTIHGSTVRIHESQNRTPGSMNRSIEGLQNIFVKGIRVIIKHCITKMNYLDTTEFVKFIDDAFHPSIEIQLWGLDYCGIEKENAKDLYVNYKELSPYLESALDLYLERSRKNYRPMTLHNIPLCWVDPYYWNLFDMNEVKHVYSRYNDPSNALFDMGDDSGCLAENCSVCNVRKYCSGTYRSAFDLFGEDLVKPINAEIYLEGE